MFCMECGAEVPGYLDVCPVCGRATGVPASEVPSVAPTGAAWPVAPPPEASATSAPAPFPLVAPAHPSIGPGDLNRQILPRDRWSFLILVTSVALAADVLAPWFAVAGDHVPLTRIGTPILALLGLLAVPPLAVRPAVRRQPLWSVLPLALGAAFLGAGAGVVVLLSWLAPRVALIGGAQSPDAAPFAGYAPDIGLYLFLGGAAVLLVGGYQLLLAAREEDAFLAAAAFAPPAAPVPPAGIPAATLAASPADPFTGPFTGWRDAQPASLNGHAAATPAPAAHPTSAEPPLPQPSGAPAGAILPGTPGWNQAQDAPTPLRAPSIGGWPRPQGVRRGR